MKYPKAWEFFAYGAYDVYACCLYVFDLCT